MSESPYWGPVQKKKRLPARGVIVKVIHPVNRWLAFETEDEIPKDLRGLLIPLPTTDPCATEEEQCTLEYMSIKHPAFKDHPVDYAPGIHRCIILRVVDGDTYDVILDLGFRRYSVERIRLRNVDTPEVYGPNAEPAGAVASEAVKNKVADCEGYAVLAGTDPDAMTFGRFVADVFLYTPDKGALDLGRWITENGYGTKVD